MTNLALIIMASLPFSWIVVGSVLIVVTLIAVVMLLVKSREVIALKKEVEDLRETMRMMRYEEANLSRMLHTVDKSVGVPENVFGKDEEFSERVVEEEIDRVEQVGSLEEPEIPEEPVTGSTIRKEALLGKNEAKEEEVAEEESDKEDSLEMPLTEASEESMDIDLVAIEPIAETSPGETSIVEASNEVGLVVEKPIEIGDVLDSGDSAVQQNKVDSKEENFEVLETPEVKPRKHAINERRPAIPNDLFSAWFEENEQYEAEEELNNGVATEMAEVSPETLDTIQPELQDSEQEKTEASLVLVEEVSVPVFTEVSASDDSANSEVMVDEQTATSVVLSKEDERFCRKLERVVNARMRNPNLNVDIIASQFGMGRTNFYRKVRELMGVSPNDYLRKCRMERAAELLHNSDLPVVDICAQVGIPDAQYFSRVFKTYFGMPPSVYREQKNG